MKTYRFTKQQITVGRSPDSDVFLDNPGVSRTHIILQRASNGSYRVQDQGSANGTYVNDEQVTSEILLADDIVRIGKFSLWIDYENDLRAEPQPQGSSVSPQAYQGTTVLSTNELEDMLESARSKDREVARSRADMAVVEKASFDVATEPARRRLMVGVGLAAFVVGSLAGATVTWLVGR